MPTITPIRSDRGTLARFRGDRAANTMAIMAASVFPLVAGVGAAIDMSRNYMAKSRLQQACDAGVLAGRKLQGGNPYSTVSDQAARYFRINFPDGLYDTGAATFTSDSVANNEVMGNAAVFVPSTIGSVIGYQGTDLEVTCGARLDISDTDVMFVLDLTGSMNCSSTAGVNCPNVDNNGIEWGSTANPSESDKLNDRSRIGALRSAVIQFTNSVSSSATPSTEIRYGFVPYAGSVNVGRLLQPSWINDTASYASRQALYDSVTATSQTTNGAVTYSCPAGYSRSGTVCTRLRWTHKNRQLDITKFKLFEDVALPSSVGSATSRWGGCIEERSTTPATSFDPVPAAALDLDMDLPATNQASRWSPLWQDAEYFRDGDNEQVFSGTDSAARQFSAACPATAKLPEVPATASSVRDYMLALKPGGATYHDIGMIWGLRLLSPTGLWASNNAPRPGNVRVRHIIFMTDGEMKPWDNFSGSYGIERHMKRVAGGATAQTTLINRHNARFLAACKLARDRYNVKVWAIAFGENLDNTKLRQCADTGHAYQANDPATLNTIFEEIAAQVADLRLSR